MHQQDTRKSINRHGFLAKRAKELVEEPSRPKMKSTPLIATITGNMKGADKIEISTSRPLKFWRANARDAGIALKLP